MEYSTHHNEVMSEAWNRGLKVLKPTDAQLEHGLDLHQKFITCDNFCFMRHCFRMNG